MTHEEVQAQLEDYVDDRLDRPARRSVDQHLGDCEECRSILDEVAPVDMSAIGSSQLDERMIRRTVRRSVWRTALNAALILLAGLIGLWLLSALLFQPFVINRGDRAADAAQATIDVTTMFNPGAAVTGGEIQSGFFDREINLDVILPIGGGQQDVGPVSFQLGALNLTGPNGGPPSFYLETGGQGDGAREQVGQLGPGTVATVKVDFIEPISIEDAQAIADSDDFDLRVVWVGFDATPGDSAPLAWSPSGTLGYATCLGPGDVTKETLGASSAGFRENFGFAPASVTEALSEVQRGLANLLANPALLDDIVAPFHSINEVQPIADIMSNDPLVDTIVVTGPSPAIASFLESFSLDDVTGQVLAADFYNWSPPICGR